MPGQSTGQRGAVASTTTFLFTDIEGSTKILQQLGREYEKVLEIHRRMLRKAFHDNHGKEVKVDGDAFFVAFPSAGQAVAASVSAQRELARYRWPQGQSVRVRIGLHTGEAIETGNDYVGIDVHRAARIGAAAHGGQILLSQTTATLAEPSLGEGVSVRDLGEYRLKDLTRPERIFQIDIDGLPADFPPLRSVDYTPNNLPTQLTSFIGREQELAEAKRLLGTTRLLTLTGSGGSGKTRLGIQLAADVAAGFPDGVYFVPLAAIRDAHLVPSSIAQNIGLQELQDAGDRTLLERLSSFLRDKQMLVVLDNFEQLLAAGSVVADVLRSTQTVQVVVTSRSPLRISGEQEFAVPPLAVPEQRAAPSPASIAGCASVRLFCERAVAALPDFAIDDDNAAHVAHITRRLDGLPLAIELAAARIKLLPPEAMLPRLEHSLRLLVGGGRDLADRQQTLRNTIAWSYELLAGGPKRLLAACSVFRGGASL